MADYVPAWSTYEEVTESLIGRLAACIAVTTTRIERDVALRGRSGVNQVDVVWEFVDGVGRRSRVLFECRSYSRRINQQALHSWRSVVDDLSTPGIETIGVMVTTVGYQSGALGVADTYGLLVLELRQPSTADTAGRIEYVNMRIAARIPFVRDWRIEAVEVFIEGDRVQALSTDLELEAPSGERRRAVDALLAGELNHIDDVPTPSHEVALTFEPPETLLDGGAPIALITRLLATIGEEAVAPIDVRVGGFERLAWVLKNSLTGSCVWFAHDGRIWATST